MLKTLTLTGLFLLLLQAAAFAQDSFFAQQYASKQQLNPAFTAIQSQYEFTIAHRDQWPNLSNSFVNSQFMGAYRFNDGSSAAGFRAFTDRAGNGGFTRVQLNGSYAYHTGLSDILSLSLGLEAGYGSQKVDFAKLVFGDQITADGVVNTTTLEINSYEPVNYFTAGTGAVIYSDQFWLSVSANHLNQPNLGFNVTDKLPLLLKINTGYKFYIQSSLQQNQFIEKSVTPSISYFSQGSFRKLDLGLHTTLTPITLGIIYHGFVPGAELGYEQMLSLLGGIAVNKIRGAYAYSFGLSGFTAKLGGAHEISITLDEVDFNKLFKKRLRNKKTKLIPCPEF